MLVRRARKGAVPIIILAGFLGSGKTTILNYLLRNSAGSKIGVIVNDFGELNIDTMLISAETDRKLEMTNGCICCSVDGGELDETISALLTARPDVIVIEASGLAEPEELARMVILSPNKKVGYGGMVYVVDALNYRKTVEKHRSLNQHIKAADLVVLTKCDQLSEKAKQNLIAEINDQTKSPLVPIDRGELSPRLLYDIPEFSRIQPSLLQQDTEQTHIHEEYQSLVFTTTHPISPDRFRKFMSSLPRGVYRTKGIMYFGMAGYEQKYIVQSVGKKWDMYAEAWSENENPHTSFVLIGLGFNKDEVLRELHAAIGESTSMLDIERFMSN